MCTAVSFQSGRHYFGRNLDLAYHYDEAVTVTPRNYPFVFRFAPHIRQHYAIIGMATVADEYPLYYDGTNDAGLSVAGLNFPGNAYYETNLGKPYTIAPFEFIPWVLCQCGTVEETVSLLEKSQMCKEPFSEAYTVTDLHWIISDSKKSVTVEPERNGLQITSNPVNVLTNNPPFDYHLKNLQNYQHLSNSIPAEGLLSGIPFTPYSNGLGAWGLPGDPSSLSRFVRAVFTAKYCTRPTEEAAAITQFFHILGTVNQTEGCTREQHGFTKTVYSSCCDTGCGKYYYTTYENPQIRCVRLTDENKYGSKLNAYPLDRSDPILVMN